MQQRGTGWLMLVQLRSATVPDYYDGAGGMQPFDVIDAFNLDFYEGNVVKYIIRWRRKNGVDDLRKARTYIDECIKRAEGDIKGG